MLLSISKDEDENIFWFELKVRDKVNVLGGKGRAESKKKVFLSLAKTKTLFEF